MEPKITAVKENELEDIVRILDESPLGKRYYPTTKMMYNTVKNAIKNDLLYVAKVDNNVAGFIWFTLFGGFATYPYLHIVAVDEKYRGKGVGSKLISFYENKCLTLRKELRGKSFLVVSKDNTKAQKLYEHLGYKKIFPLDNLFRKGVTEILMKKDIVRSL